MSKKYTFLRLVGGLGNQLFIYAFGFAYSKKKNTQLIIDNVSGFGKRDFYGGIFSLDGLNIKEKFIDQTLFKFLIANRYFWYLSRKLKISFTENDDTRFNENIWETNSQFYQGYWQSYKYFNEYREVIKKNLTLNEIDKPEIDIYKNNILRCKNSVAICMRFYEANPDQENKYQVYDEKYYKKAIELLESKESNLSYFVFTVNIERAKKLLCNIKDKDFIYINPLKEMKDAKFDLYLMSLCNHFIISNSTMYWWAAYLGEQEKSHVIAPKDGFINKDALLPNWIKI